MAAPVEPDPVALASLQADQLPQPLASAAANQVPVEQGQHAAGQGHEVCSSTSFTIALEQAQAQPRPMQWCDWEGNPVSWAGPLPSIDMVSKGLAFASPSMLRFPAP
ncbi:hypothetical protein OS493_005484 [Desmophyllum pertusum]|uniref:Uncharacterized protein n=1 Tax=Desmophyllum pertusum TaxID=174260 RepID=A0A9W9YSB5_9CNID|nr:hypothetical protein OS493_005484 [Desmophyllum pertusum]